MASEPRPWRVPVPLSLLTWWPLAAFVMVLFDPEVSPALLAGAGVVLLGLGVLVAVLTGRRVPVPARPAAGEAVRLR